MNRKLLMLIILFFIKTYIFSQAIDSNRVAFMNICYQNKIYFNGDFINRDTQKQLFYYAYTSFKYIEKFYNLDTLYNIYFGINNDTTESNYYVKYSDFSVMVFLSIPNIYKEKLRNEIFRPGILILIPPDVKEFKNITLIKLLDYAINNIYKLRIKAEDVYFNYPTSWKESITFFSKEIVDEIINSDLPSEKNKYIEKIYKKTPPKKYLRRYYENEYFKAFQCE